MTNKIKIWAVLVWIVVWQIGSMAVGYRFLLPPPLSVGRSLLHLLGESDFYLSVFSSIARISIGFLSGFVAAVALAPLSVRYRYLGELLAPLVFTIKTVPVASFIILILIWASAKQMSIIIAFMMVFPILYTNIRSGIQNTDKKLLEFSKVFALSKYKEFRYIYLPEIMPLLTAGASLSVGLAWKAGIAAEIIGLPRHSIGESLYNAKIYFDTENLFAWTFVIVCLSILFEKTFMLILKRITGQKKISR
ncbi:MAG: ABC transporter permease subunit [Bacillota bacterium]|nr:ABC transporter permease subunit [Bacillota bacterium]